MSPLIGVLLLSGSDERKRGWAAKLAELPCEAASDPGRLSSLDIIFTDEPLDSGKQQRLSARAPQREVGVIAIGCRGPADLSLPEEPTAGELRLACLLLGQIVRLRRDRREDERICQALRYLAETDPLTGLANRRAYDDELARRLAAVRQQQQRTLCLGLIDLDGFKSVNNQQGHAQGDQLLTQAGRALTESVRGGDFVARLGGDEFAVLISDLDPGDALRVVDRVRSAVCSALEPEGQVTASAGVAIADQHVCGDELFLAADRALLDAKSRGRNRTQPRRAQRGR